MSKIVRCYDWHLRGTTDGKMENRPKGNTIEWNGMEWKSFSAFRNADKGVGQLRKSLEKSENCIKNKFLGGRLKGHCLVGKRNFRQIAPKWASILSTQNRLYIELGSYSEWENGERERKSEKRWNSGEKSGKTEWGESERIGEGERERKDAKSSNEADER